MLMKDLMVEIRSMKTLAVPTGWDEHRLPGGASTTSLAPLLNVGIQHTTASFLTVPALVSPFEG